MWVLRKIKENQGHHKDEDVNEEAEEKMKNDNRMKKEEGRGKKEKEGRMFFERTKTKTE